MQKLFAVAALAMVAIVTQAAPPKVQLVKGSSPCEEVQPYINEKVERVVGRPLKTEPQFDKIVSADKVACKLVYQDKIVAEYEVFFNKYGTIITSWAWIKA